LHLLLATLKSCTSKQSGKDIVHIAAFWQPKFWQIMSGATSHEVAPL